MPTQRITLKDVAAECGCTINTVSRAMRDDARLSEATRARVQETARRMGYIRNSRASSLRSGQSHIVAVVVNDVHNPHFSRTLSRIDAELRRAGYDIMILCMQNDEKQGEQMIRTAISQGVDGILYFPYINSPDHIRYMRANGMPFVLLDRRIEGVDADNVRCDDVRGGYLAGDRLASLGHERFLFLSSFNKSSSQVDRLRGFREALRDRGLPDDCARVLPGDIVEEALANGDMRDILQPLDYTAVVAFRDEFAYCAATGLEALGRRVPQDVSMIGFDHLRAAAKYLPRIDSIYADGTDVGTRGVRMLLRRIANPELPTQVEVLPVRLYEEGTSVPPHA